MYINYTFSSKRRNLMKSITRVTQMQETDTSIPFFIYEVIIPVHVRTRNIIHYSVSIVLRGIVKSSATVALPLGRAELFSCTTTFAKYYKACLIPVLVCRFLCLSQALCVIQSSVFYNLKKNNIDLIFAPSIRSSMLRGHDVCPDFSFLLCWQS